MKNKTQNTVEEIIKVAIDHFDQFEPDEEEQKVKYVIAISTVEDKLNRWIKNFINKNYITKEQAQQMCDEARIGAFEEMYAKLIGKNNTQIYREFVEKEVQRFVKGERKKYQTQNTVEEIIFKAKRIDNDSYVEGHYFVTPLTDENSGTDSKSGWFFLSDGIKRHCIEADGVVYVIDITTLKAVTHITKEQAQQMCEEYLDGFVIACESKEIDRAVKNNGSGTVKIKNLAGQFKTQKREEEQNHAETE